MKYKKERYINQRYSKQTDSWSFQVIIRDKNNTITKTFNEKNYGSTRRAYDEAIIFRNKKLMELENGIRCSNSNKLLKDVFYETFSLLPVREETKRKHIMYFNKHIDDEIEIKKVTRSMVVQSLNKMISDCSDDTINRVLSIWRRIFKTALINEYVGSDPTLGIVAPKSQIISQKRREVITDRHTFECVLERLADNFSKSEAQSVRMALETMWYCGLRPCECFALNVDDIKDGYIDVNKGLGSDITDDTTEINEKSLNVIRRCKTSASIRKVPIPKQLQELYDNYKVKGDILFPTNDGAYFNVNSVGVKIHSYGIPFNMYQLRHTVATRLVTNGVDQRTIIEILGHEHIDMSVYYARSNGELKRNALEM